MSDTYNAENFKAVFEKNFTWLSGFLRNVRRRAGRTAVIDPLAGRSWTYAELNADVNRLANRLKASGVGCGDMVLYQLYNSPQFLFCYLAPQKLGAVNSPANVSLSAGETARLLDRDRPKAYVYDLDVREMAWRALELCRHKPEIILAVDYRATGMPLPLGHVRLDAFMRDGAAAEPELSPVSDMYTEVTRLGTSGTSGIPKGVPLNNVNEIMSAHDSIIHLPMTPEDVTLNMTPWFHRGGLHCGGPTPTLYVGAALVTMRMFSAKACFDCVRQYGVTFLIGVPSALNNLAARQEKHPEPLTSLRGIVTMGSPLEQSDCIRYQRLLTPNILNGYGTTETYINTYLRPYDLPAQAGSAGTACVDDDVRIVRMYEDRQAEPDELVPMDGETQGEVVIFAGGKSALSYVGGQTQDAEKYHGGWFYTKDVGTWDANGYITILGRKDDMIICMGENIYPAQLEEILNRHAKVRDCMVTGVPDEARGESVAAYIIPADKSLTVKELGLYCAESDDLSGYKCPRYYAFVETLPYNATGKKQHVLLRKQAEEDLQLGRLLHP